MISDTSIVTRYKSAGNYSGKYEKIVVKLGNPIFSTKYRINGYRDIFCYKAIYDI